MQFRVVRDVTMGQFVSLCPGDAIDFESAKDVYLQAGEVYDVVSENSNFIRLISEGGNYIFWVVSCVPSDILPIAQRRGWIEVTKM